MTQKNNVNNDISNANGEKTTDGSYSGVRQREAQLRRYSLYLSIALAFALIIAGIAISFGLQARQQALIALLNTPVTANQAQQKISIARAGELAAQSISAQDTNYPLAPLLAIEAYRTFDTGLTRTALLDAVQTRPELMQVLDEHTPFVYSIAFSPDGKILAAGDSDSNIVLWNMNTRLPIGQPLKASGTVNSMAFSPDGAILASGQDGSITFWNTATRQQIGQPIKVGNNGIRDFVFSPDGKTIASVGDGGLILWDVATRQPIGQPLNNNSSIAATANSNLAFSPDGKTLASSSIDGNIILWDTVTRQQIGKPMKGSTYGVDIMGSTALAVESLAFSPDGRWLAVGNAGGTISVWDTTTYQPIPIYLPQQEVGHSRVASLAFSPDSAILASGNSDGTINLWQMNNMAFGLTVRQIKNISSVISLAFSPDGQTLASAGEGGNIYLLHGQFVENAGGQSLVAIPGNPPTIELLNPTLDWTPATTLFPQMPGTTPTPYYPLNNAQEEAITWDSATRNPVAQWLTNRQNAVTAAVAFSPDGKTLASGTLDNSIILWDVATRRPIGKQIAGHNAPIMSITFSPDGKTLAFGNGDGSIILWDTATRQPIGQPLTEHTWGVTSIVYSPDGKTFASSSNDRTIIIWDATTHRPIGPPLTGHTDGVRTLAFSPDGKTLASGSYDYHVILWDVATHKNLGQLMDINWVLRVAFSPDGKMLATYDNWGLITLWDVTTRQPIGQPFRTFGKAVYDYKSVITGLAFSSDGKTLASDSNGPTIMLWDVDPLSWVQKTCQRVGRNFTQAEWAQYFPDEPYRVTCPQWPSEQ